MYRKSRQCYKLKSLSKKQSAISHFTKLFLKKAEKNAKDKDKKIVIFFGDGTFRPGGSGYAAVLKKSFIRLRRKNWGLCIQQ